MSSLYTIIGDPHLKHSNMDIMLNLCLKVEKLGNPTIWLGDLLDTKEVIRGKCLTFWINYFSNSKLVHYVLVGNHDYFNLDCEGHSLEALKLIPNVRLIDKPQDFVNTPFYMIPYINDEKILKDAVKNGPQDSVLIGHLELKGFDFGNGHICTNGMTERSFTKFKRVISGHFHKYQEKGNLVYLGTPFSHSFGEANQDKFIGIYDTETNELKLEKTDLPKHVSIEFDCDYSYEQSGDEMHHAFTFDMRPQDHHRVILTGTQENIDRFPKEIYTKNPECKLKIKFISRPKSNVANDVTVDETFSNEKQFVTWAKEIKGLNEGTIQLGLEIMGAVSGK